MRKHLAILNITPWSSARLRLTLLSPGLLFATILSVGWSACETTAGGIEYAIGADVSFLRHAEDSGVVFRDNGEAMSGLEILKRHGYNWVRLRLFHSPHRLPNNLEYTIRCARQAKEMGFKFLLDFHYSDTWADPGKQFLPAAWRQLNHEQLTEAVYQYTKDSLSAFQEADATPDMVQIGNEITVGMLWPDGKLPQNWPQFADLVRAGIRGVHDVRTEGRSPQIMIHIDRGGDKAATKSFFDNCQRHNIEFDVIGQSYYPWWHGSLEDLRENLDFMANEYDKDIILVEVAYNWRQAEYRTAPGPFPETPQGQRDFLRAVDEIVRATPGGRGKGIFWWEPAVRPGHIASRGMFDDDGNALPVISVFDGVRTAEAE